MNPLRDLNRSSPPYPRMPAHNPQLLNSLSQLHISPTAFLHRPEPTPTPPGSHQENSGAHISHLNSPVQPVASSYAPQSGPTSIPTLPEIERQSRWRFPQYVASRVQSSALAPALCATLGSAPTSPVLGLQHSNTFPQYVTSPVQLLPSAPMCPPRPGPTRTLTGSSQTSSGSTPTSRKDAQTSSWGKRFVGNHSQDHARFCRGALVREPGSVLFSMPVAGHRALVEQKILGSLNASDLVLRVSAPLQPYIC